MIRASLDTCAIIDFCERFYKEDIFPTLWSRLEEACVAGQVKFEIAEGIHKETVSRLELQGIDESTFQKFKVRFKVDIIVFSDYSPKVNEIKISLIKSQSYKTSDYVSGDVADVHAMAICLLHSKHSLVLTSEQGFLQHPNAAKPQSKKTKAKLPDACNELKIGCGNWTKILEHLGINI